jgi:hypothetical protein
MEGQHPPGQGPAGDPKPEAVANRRWWVRTEYLLWWIKDSNFPVLLTTGQTTDPRPGALGMPGTRILFGGPSDNQERSGARVGLGYWLDDAHQWGVEATYLFLSDRSVGAFAAGSGKLGSQVLARPFFNVQTNQEDSSLVALPGLAGGNVNIGSRSELHSGELNALCNLSRSDCFCVDVLAGFRILDLDEQLQIVEGSMPLATSPLFPEQRIIVTDRFAASNTFYGGQLGLRTGITHERWRAEVTAKVGLGLTTETLNIGGTTSIIPPGQQPTVLSGGLLALGSNSGRTEHDRFAVVPQLDATLGYLITPWLKASVGYSLVYWSAVVRPGDQIERGINVNQVPTSLSFGQPGGPPRPALIQRETDFWAHGLHIGLEFRF